MIGLKTWLYFLVDGEGRCYAVESDQVVTTNQIKMLPNSPDGWQDITLGWHRELATGGSVAKFGFPQTFVTDGARIISDTVYRYNFEKEVRLIIKKLDWEHNPSSFRAIYRHFYDNRLDLVSFHQEDDIVKCAMKEGGLAKAVREKGSTDFELKLDKDYINVLMDGMYLYATATFALPVDADIDDTTPRMYRHYVPIQFVQKEGDNAGIGFFSQLQERWDDLERQLNTTNMFAEVDKDVTEDIEVQLKLKGSIEVTQSTFQEDDIWFSIFSSDDTLPFPGVVAESNHLGKTTGTYEVNIDQSVTLKAGHRLFFVQNHAGDELGIFNRFIYHWKEGSTFEVVFKSRMRPTTIRAKWERQVAKELTEKMSGSAGNFQSNLLSNAHFALTCGDAIRGLEGARMKTNWKALAEHLRVVHFSGWNVENNKLIVEPIPYFIKPWNPTNLGICKDLKTDVAQDLLASEVHVGYNEKEIAGVNGKYEFNNTYKYTTPVSSAEKTLSVVSPYCAQPFYIEVLRINLENKKTTDDKADNEIFVLNVEPEPMNDAIVFGSGSVLEFNFPVNLKFYLLSFSFPGPAIKSLKAGDKIRIEGANINNGTFTIISGAATPTLAQFFVREPLISGTMFTGRVFTDIYRLKRKTYSSWEGVPNIETVFNIEDLTPKRLLKKWKQWIDSICWHFKGSKLIYQTTDKNPQLKTVDLIQNEDFDEDADFEIGDSYLFAPFYHQCELEVPAELPALLKEDINRAFSVLWYEQVVAGVYIDIGIAPDTNKEQVLKLLSSPENNLLNLV